MLNTAHVLNGLLNDHIAELRKRSEKIGIPTVKSITAYKNHLGATVDGYLLDSSRLSMMVGLFILGILLLSA